MRDTLKAAIAIALFVLGGCGHAQSLTIDESLLDVVVPEDLEFERQNGRDVLVAQVEDGKMVVDNLLSWGRIGNHRFFFFFFEYTQSSGSILAIEASSGVEFNVYSLDQQYSLFAPEYGLLAEVTPRNQLTSRYTFSVVDPVTDSIVAEEELRFDLTAIGSKDLPSFNYVEPRLRAGMNEKTGHPFIELENIQAGYAISKVTFWIEVGETWKQGIGQSDHQDTPRPHVELRRQLESWWIEFEGVTAQLPELPAIERPISGVADTHGRLAVVTYTGGDEHSIANYTMWVFALEDDAKRQFALEEYFVYRDPILNISGGSWTDDTVALIIDTSEFNYDFLFDVSATSATSYLRSSEYNRFVR